jgi:adenylate cyclase
MNMTSKSPDLTNLVRDAKILIVDDEPFSIVFFERLLRAAGYRNIQSTTNPRSVEELHRASRFDLILLDIHMPGMSGLDVLDRLKELDPSTHVPVIVLTGDEDVATRIAALEKGARDFLTKPPPKAEALSRIRNMLEVRILDKQNQLERENYQHLLGNVLPAYIVERLNAGEDEIVDEFEDVAVIFCDLVGFSDACARVEARIIVADLNRIFVALDLIAARFRVEKIKTIGDAYMAVTGLAESDKSHFDRMADFALAALNALDALQPELAVPFRMRIGIERGRLIAGVLRGRRSAFDVWGDVVNAASRLQAASLPGRITISSRFVDGLSETFDIEPRNAIELKGIGRVDASFLNGRKS